ncbi:MAG TPA: hypothetical protein G4O07_07780 [Dehalococcoidia bacterium]|nr:hypothetical protein [Dehalococcoidia bacterium]
MSDSNRIDYRMLEAGYGFPPTSYRVDSSMVTAYLTAVGDDSDLYRDSDLVPPMALAAHALAALSGTVSFPDGSVHVSQSVEFAGTITTGDTITSQATVGRIQKRGKFHMLSMNLTACKPDNSVVFRGKTDFILPEQS